MIGAYLPMPAIYYFPPMDRAVADSDPATLRTPRGPRRPGVRPGRARPFPRSAGAAGSASRPVSYTHLFGCLYVAGGPTASNPAFAGDMADATARAQALAQANGMSPAKAGLLAVGPPATYRQPKRCV